MSKTKLYVLVSDDGYIYNSNCEYCFTTQEEAKEHVKQMYQDGDYGIEEDPNIILYELTEVGKMELTYDIRVIKK